MDRFFLYFMSVQLVGVVCCSEKQGWKTPPPPVAPSNLEFLISGSDGRYGQGNFQERELSRSKRSGRWHQPCPCPDLEELQNPKKHNSACPCDGFNLRSLSEHHRHHRPRKTKQLLLHKKDKCRKFLRHCAFKGIHIPL